MNSKRNQTLKCLLLEKIFHAIIQFQDEFAIKIQTLFISDLILLLKLNHQQFLSYTQCAKTLISQNICSKRLRLIYWGAHFLKHFVRFGWAIHISNDFCKDFKNIKFIKIGPCPLSLNAQVLCSILRAPQKSCKS